jgi:hypothetical protein
MQRDTAERSCGEPAFPARLLLPFVLASMLKFQFALSAMEASKTDGVLGLRDVEFL